MTQDHGRGRARALALLDDSREIAPRLDRFVEALARRVIEHPLQIRSTEAPLPSAPLLLVGLERDVNR